MAEKAPRQFHLAAAPTSDGRRGRTDEIDEPYRDFPTNYIPLFMRASLPFYPGFPSSSFSPLKTEEEEAHSIFVESTQEEGRQACSHALSEQQTLSLPSPNAPS